MPTNTKIALSVLALIGIVVFVSYAMGSMSRASSIANQKQMSPSPAIVQDNPAGLPVDPKSGLVIVPTVASEIGSAMNPLNASNEGRIAGPTACDKLQNVLSCYLQKAPDLATGYESMATGDLYGSDAPTVREQKCSATLDTLAQTPDHRIKAIQAGCVW